MNLRWIKSTNLCNLFKNIIDFYGHTMLNEISPSPNKSFIFCWAIKAALRGEAATEMADTMSCHWKLVRKGFCPSYISNHAHLYVIYRVVIKAGNYSCEKNQLPDKKRSVRSSLFGWWPMEGLKLLYQEMRKMCDHAPSWPYSCIFFSRVLYSNSNFTYPWFPQAFISSTWPQTVCRHMHISVGRGYEVIWLELVK